MIEHPTDYQKGWVFAGMVAREQAKPYARQELACWEQQNPAFADGYKHGLNSHGVLLRGRKKDSAAPPDFCLRAPNA